MSSQLFFREKVDLRRYDDIKKVKVFHRMSFRKTREEKDENVRDSRQSGYSNLLCICD